MAKKPSSGHQCTYCNAVYNKKDFSLCPYCGADGGAVTPKVWKPTKRQSKEFAKKQAALN